MQNINQKKDNIVNKNIHYALSVRLKKKESKTCSDHLMEQGNS
jgi:hypothetical protein